MDSQEILSALSSGNFFVSVHGLERMMQRDVFEVDIKCVADTCTEVLQQNHGTWRVDGFDTHNIPLTVIVAEEDGVIIVTVY